MFKRIVVATDLSDSSFEVVKGAGELRKYGAEECLLLHVQDRNRIEPYLSSRLDEFNEIDGARLDSLRRRLEAVGRAAVDTEIRYGKPFVEIDEAASERGADLVVMGFQGRGFVGGLFIGSVSQNVARYASSSVLLVPAEISI